MGCESSKTAYENLSQRRNTLVVKPKAAIKVDDGVKLADEKGTILIFIFGKFLILLKLYNCIALKLISFVTEQHYVSLWRRTLQDGSWNIFFKFKIKFFQIKMNEFQGNLENPEFCVAAKNQWIA